MDTKSDLQKQKEFFKLQKESELESRKAMYDEKVFNFQMDSRKQSMNLAARIGLNDTNAVIKEAQQIYDWLIKVKPPTS